MERWLSLLLQVVKNSGPCREQLCILTYRLHIPPYYRPANLLRVHSCMCQVINKILSTTHPTSDSPSEMIVFLPIQQSDLDCNVPNGTQGCSWTIMVKGLLKSRKMTSLLFSPQPQFNSFQHIRQCLTSTLGKSMLANPFYCFAHYMTRNCFQALVPQFVRDQSAADQPVVPQINFPALLEDSRRTSFSSHWGPPLISTTIQRESWLPMTLASSLCHQKHPI